MGVWVFGTVSASAIFKMDIAAHLSHGRDGRGGGGVRMVHYVDALLAVVKYQYVKQLGEDVGRKLDLTMVQMPELTERIVSAYPHLKTIEAMAPTEFKKELAATTLQKGFLRRRAQSRVRAKTRQLRRQLAELRGDAGGGGAASPSPRKAQQRRGRRSPSERRRGGAPSSEDRSGRDFVSEDIERMSVVEMTAELRASGGTVI